MTLWKAWTILTVACMGGATILGFLFSFHLLFAGEYHRAFTNFSEACLCAIALNWMRLRKMWE